MPDEEGWYPDPEFPGRKRYWNGNRWGSVDSAALEEDLYSFSPPANTKPDNGAKKKSFYAQAVESKISGYSETFDSFTNEKKKTIIFAAVIIFISLSIIFGIFSIVLSGYNYARESALDLANNSRTSLSDGNYEMASDGMLFNGETCAFIGTPQKVGSFRDAVPETYKTIVVGTGVSLCGDATNSSLVRFTVDMGTAYITSID